MQGGNKRINDIDRGEVRKTNAQIEMNEQGQTEQGHEKQNIREKKNVGKTEHGEESVYGSGVCGFDCYFC